jgi:hypothetical protein
MKNLLYILLLVAVIGKGHTQGVKKNLDFIVVIDDAIAVGSISLPKIIFVSGGRENVIQVNYYPGSLSMDANDYPRLLSDSTKAIYLKFNHHEYVGGKLHYDNYEIELKKPWLEDYFNIIHIYNLVNPRYKNKYDPIGKGKNYAYELESPSHSFKLVQKSVNKK